MQEPLVSVVIPVYNGADYLRDALESVLNQTYQNIEIILVNDGSNDDSKTEQIAHSYGNRICYIEKTNGGTASALNMGIKYMHGDYFAWLSHDDIFYPEKIEKQMQMIQKEKVLITACSYDIFYNSGRTISVPMLDFYAQNLLNKSVFSVINSIIQFGGCLLHKDVFEIYGLFHENLPTTQDYEFLFRILRKEKCSYSNEVLYGIRYHEKQGSNTIASVLQDRDALYQMFLTELSDAEKEEMYDSVYNFYYQLLLRIIPMSGMTNSFSECIKGLQMSAVRLNEQGKKRQRHAVYIYGAGAYGRRLLFDLRCHEISVVGFLDKREELNGIDIQGVLCRSKVDILKEQQVTIIIASLYRNEIAKELQQVGIKNYVFKEDYEKEMRMLPPDIRQVEYWLREYDRNGWIDLRYIGH